MGRIIGDLISPEYQDQIRRLHGLRTWGDGGHKYAPEVRRLLRHVEGTTVLDYGCGRGTLRELLPKWIVREYDPGIEGKESLPAPADVVVCTDVLEHIEPDRIIAVLAHLYELTLRACFAVICTRAAETMLPDGRNAHLIIQDAGWWIRRLRQWDWVIDVRYRKRGLLVVQLTRRRT